MKRLGVSILSLMCVLGLVTFAHAQESRSIADLQAQIQSLQQQVQDLQSQLQTIAGDTQEDEESNDDEEQADEGEEATEDEQSGPPQFVQTMFRGMRGPSVERLQKILATDSNVYPQGLTTGYFGEMTEEALRRFQEQHGLPKTGILDAKTKETINKILTTGAGNSGTIPPGLLKKFGDGSVLENLPDEADARCKAADMVPQVAAEVFADCPEDEGDESESDDEEDSEGDEEESDENEDDMSGTSTDSGSGTSTNSS